jgi:hypothetical protein
MGLDCIEQVTFEAIMEVDLAFQMIFMSLFTIFCFLVRFMIVVMIRIH